MAYWLLKTEPLSFSIDDLKSRKTEPWDGVRSYQARNMLQSMKPGEKAFFYHSSCQPPGIAGICKVLKEAYPDPSQFDPASKYFDPRSKPEKPLWFMPDVGFVRKFKRLITLTELRDVPELVDMVLLRKGSRLSVQPVTDQQWDVICEIAEG